MRPPPLVLLLAEDDEGHATLVLRILKRAGIADEVVRFCDGQEALEYVRSVAGDGPRRRGGPLLLLLDINMPRMDGIEVLRRLKEDNATATIPVIMLTTTDDPREIERCYELGCSVYVTKPVEYAAFVEAVHRLGLFLKIVNVPHGAQT